MKGGSGGGPKVGRNDIGILILRLAVGLIMLIYGCQKMFGLFGGNGFSATVDGMSKGMGLPPALVMMSIATEFFGALAIVLGFLTPVAAAAMTINMAVATFFTAKRPDALHDAFVGGKPNELMYPLLLCLASLAIAIIGAGKYSLDAKFFRRA